MAIERVFLGLERPALELAADYLLERFAGRNASADLRKLHVVLPTARAGRRLLEILVDRCERTDKVFTPPEINSVGRFPDLLYRAKFPFADELTQQLAWADVLRRFDRDRLRAVVPHPPHDDDSPRWRDLGRMLHGLHRELASEALGFADVVEHGKQLPEFRETERWRTLAALQDAYHRRLDELELWDRQTARRVAIERRECRLDQPLVLIGAVDLNHQMRRMLDQVAEHVTALVVAPKQWAGRFDEHGCLSPEAWAEATLEIDDTRVLRADDPDDQADAIVRRIAELGGRFRAEQITIGLPDERIVPQIVRRLDECELPNRYGPGVRLGRSSVARWLADLADWHETGRYPALAALVRHPDIEQWLGKQQRVPLGWIEELDEYFNQHLPLRPGRNWLGDPEQTTRLRAAAAQIDQLVSPLVDEPRPIGEWVPALGRALMEVYGARTFDIEQPADRLAWKACVATQAALDNLQAIPPSLAPVVSAADAIRFVLETLEGEFSAPAAVEPAIELVGWLECPLDDAPALIVANLNEGLIPSSVNADLFLPNGLRSTLGLNDNARRYARDAYAMAVVESPWRESVWIVARRTSDGDPLAPSRLLFAAPPEIVARRALRFFSEAETGGTPSTTPLRRPLAGALRAGRNDFAFRTPRPEPLAEPITRLSVTRFSAYLACPYRFYLSYVLRLSEMHDEATELDGGQFGDLAHKVLEQFAHCDERDSDDADAIARSLGHLLDLRVREVFGGDPAATVRIQVEQLRLRLARFAEWQAQRTRDGWEIEHVELSFSETPGRLIVDDDVMLLTGRIDRIDVHRDTGRREVLDYKTSDAGDHPDKKHRAGKKREDKTWVDLQLPLYRHLVRELGIAGDVGLGYIVLPKKLDEVGHALADWTEDELQQADETAAEIVRGIWAEEFWPPADPPPRYSEELSFILLDGVFGRRRES